MKRTWSKWNIAGLIFSVLSIVSIIVGTCLFIWVNPNNATYWEFVDWYMFLMLPLGFILITENFKKDT
jgi:hypothetical protein